jgi:hypothetical protein
MPLFWEPYVSPITQLINSLPARIPDIQAQQLAGRAILWDRPVDLTEQAEFAQGRVAQQAFVYQTKP